MGKRGGRTSLLLVIASLGLVGILEIGTARYFVAHFSKSRACIVPKAARNWLVRNK